MDGIVGSLRLGWKALLFKEDAYEEMRAADNPVVKGLILIVVVGIIIALLGLVGSTLEWASIPDLGQMRDVIHNYILRMPGMNQLPPDALNGFEQGYAWGWKVFPPLFGAPNVGMAALDIILTPLRLLIWWFIYGILAYLFAHWLGGKGDFSETLGVLALAVAPQFLNVLTLLPFVQVGSVVSIWGILCAFVGLKTAHKLSWARAVWATLLPFILVGVVLILAGCLGLAILAATTKGG
jgi:hypothetical protein